MFFFVVSVCMSVPLFTRFAGRTIEPTLLKLSTHIKDHHISDGFKGQGHQGQKCKRSDQALKSTTMCQTFDLCL